MLQLEAAESEAREQGEQGAGGSMRRDEAGRTDGHETQGIGTTAGFRFASGREVTVSEEARRKAREMLQLEAAESEVREQGEQGAGGSMRRDVAGRTDGHETQGIGTTAGFRFASGREVTVSEEARRKAREMLQLEAAESEVREQGEQGAGGSMRRDAAGRTDGHETQGIGTTAGFRFASGREVTVSEEARRKAREMLQLEAAESEAREQGEQGAGGSMRRDEAGRTDGHETQGIGTTAGFRFASGREVTVSEEARRKAREMLQLEAAESEAREQGEQGAVDRRRDERGEQMDMKRRG
ncbi:protamine protein P1 [Toxoplasma gondii VEG]|uniref:Protamine protein P1 n=1 Tax=Toxoplasma gondii (strain ATCC 50861 / VEG) TaxID=432359 RepID=V4ZH04_TOXGV|nr:protamine protein P1 [Toxoplasma gondii VEG]